MSLGSTNQNTGKLYILKVLTKDVDKKEIPPVFAVSEKVTVEEDGKKVEKWQKTSEVKDVSGTLTKVECSKREWEGQEYDVIKVTLTDYEKDESYLLDLRQNSVARNIYNSILSLKTFDNVSVGLYEKKGSGDNAGKKFPAVSVKQGGNRTEWAFKLDELPEIKKVKVGKKVAIDSSELDEFYVKHLTEFGERLKNTKQAAPPKKEVKQQQEDPLADLGSEAEQEDDLGIDSDIPF